MCLQSRQPMKQLSTSAIASSEGSTVHLPPRTPRAAYWCNSDASIFAFFYGWSDLHFLMQHRFSSLVVEGAEDRPCRPRFLSGRLVVWVLVVSGGNASWFLPSARSSSARAPDAPNLAKYARQT